MENIKRLLQRKSYRAKAGGDKMKAWVYNKDGTMHMAEDVKIPVPNSTQVLVKVHCAALNHVDYKRTRIPLLTKDCEPVGVEFVGTVEKLGWIKGDHVHLFDFAIGDVVMGMTLNGAIAEYVVADADKISIKPDSIDDEQAAAFPLSGLTAFQALRANKVHEGQIVMVIGASGATGQQFVKQAKLLTNGNAKVIGVSSTKNVRFLEGIGCDLVIDYETQAIEDMVGPGECDLIIDCVSDPNDETRVQYEETIREAGLLKKSGKYLSLNANPVDTIRKLIANTIGFNIQRPGFDAVIVNPKSKELEELASWFEQGTLTQGIEEIVKFDEKSLAAAYEKLKSMHANGKLVVRISTPRK